MALPRLLGLAFGLACLAAVGQVDALTLKGPRMQGGLVRGHTHPDAEVELNGRQVRVSPDGVFLIGFGRDADPRARLTVTLPDGSRRERVLEIAARDYDVQRIDGLPPEQVTPDQAVLDRIRREAAMVAEARRRDDPRTGFTEGFQWPLIGTITGVYGSQRILNGEPRRPHYGVDIAAKAGSLVRAPADGLVTLVHPSMYFSGGTLMLDHGHGLSSAFLHLASIRVSEGEAVEQGEPIARVGATGRATGAHLDWRINLFDQRLDPQLLVGQMPDPG